MKFLIIGAGSIGSFFGSILALQNHKVYVYGSDSLRKFLENQTFEYIDLEKKHHLLPNFKQASSLDSLEEYSPAFFDYIFISTKAYDIPTVCQIYNEILKQHSIIYLIQNGLGNGELFVKYYPNHSIYRILTTNGAQYNKVGCVEHKGKGTIQICLEHSPQMNVISKDIPVEIVNLLQIFTNCGFLTTYPDQSLSAIWQKAVINLGINAFGALMRCTNGKLLDNIDLHPFIKQIVQESLLVASHMNISLKSCEYQMQQIFNVLESTSENENSMLQDIKNKKLTEIDFLNGKILQFGKKLGISTPYNELITAMIQILEKSNVELSA